MLSRSLLTAAATAAAALTFTTAAASAQQGPVYEVDYRVDFDVTATWELHRWEERGEDWKKEDNWRAKARLTGYLEHVLFRNGQLVTQTNLGIADEKVSGIGTVETHTFDTILDKWHVDTNDCDAEHENPAGTSHLQAHPEGGLVFRAAEVAMAGFVCDSGNEEMLLGVPSRPLGAGTFDARFTLPNEAIGMGKIIQHISAADSQRSPQYCPGKEDPFVDACEFGWEGKVTFTRMEEHQYPGVPIDDTPDLPPAPMPSGPGVDPRKEAIRQIFDEAAKAPKPVDPRAQAIIEAVDQYQSGDLKLQPGCAVACTGTAGLIIGGARKPVATVKFSAKAGQKAVRLKLPTTAKRALKRAKSAKLVVTTKPRGGGKPTRRTLRVKG